MMKGYFIAKVSQYVFIFMYVSKQRNDDIIVIVFSNDCSKVVQIDFRMKSGKL